MEQQGDPRVLKQALDLTQGDRAKAYGHPKPSHDPIAGMLNALFEHKLKEPLTTTDVGLMMIAFKLGRSAGYLRRGEKVSLDSLVDIAGYAYVTDAIQEEEARLERESLEAVDGIHEMTAQEWANTSLGEPLKNAKSGGSEVPYVSPEVQKELEKVWAAQETMEGLELRISDVEGLFGISSGRKDVKQEDYPQLIRTPGMDYVIYPKPKRPDSAGDEVHEMTPEEYAEHLKHFPSGTCDRRESEPEDLSDVAQHEGKHRSV